MKNNYFIEILGYVGGYEKGENIGQLVFDFYDANYYHIGNVGIDAKGRLGWTIWNDSYEKDILGLASFINGTLVKDTVDYQMNALNEDKNRWIRAKRYIEENKFKIKYSEDELLDQIEEVHINK